MKKYRFPALSEILKVKVGTKYVWEERVRNQATLVHLLEDVYKIKLNFRAFSFYPNRLYFGMSITNNPDYQQSKILWAKIAKIFEKNKWKVNAAYQNVDPHRALPKKFGSFEDLGLEHVQVLLSELILMDLNFPSHGVGEQMMLSLFQPMIGFSKSKVSRMVYGRPGSLIIDYKTDDQLLTTLDQIAKRKSFRKEPFYVKKANGLVLPAVFKGSVCLNKRIS